ncbi:MAG: hypothetical protein WBF73_33010 [Bradyrhizobium sp.]|jgi:hypothetical protein
MAYKHEDVIKAQYDRLAAERAEIVGRYESARLNEDPDGVMVAADRITEIDAKFAALNQIANVYVAGQQRAQPQNKYGLNKDEQEIARGLASGDRSMSDEDRQRVYSEQKAKYQRMRASGEYADHQGTVRR